jgi:hypothetical protein
MKQAMSEKCELQRTHTTTTTTTTTIIITRWKDSRTGQPIAEASGRSTRPLDLLVYPQRNINPSCVNGHRQGGLVALLKAFGRLWVARALVDG